MKILKRWLHLSLVVCIAVGMLVSTPVRSPAAVLAQDDTPPAAELNPALPSAELTPQALPPELLELQAALDAFEIARRQGPEAVLALGESLHGLARDKLMTELQSARAELARTAPLQPEIAPISAEEETAANEAERVWVETNRAAPLVMDPALMQDENPAPATDSTETGTEPKVDRTVGSPPCTYATIAAAMSAAVNGDRLLLEGGVTFNEHLSIHKSLTFQGGYNGCGSGLSTPTTINGTGNGRVMYIFENLTIGLENLILTNGATTGYGAGIISLSNSQITGNNVQIHGNTSTSLGGGIYLQGARAIFTNSNIYNNAALAGAGVYGAAITTFYPVLDLQSSADIHGNQALTGSGLGGGVYMDQGTVTLADCSDIYSNSAIQGGGAYLASSTLTMGGDCSEIENNTATASGGGIYALNSTINLDDMAEVYGNRAGSGGSVGSGGGAFLDNSQLWGDLADIYYNTATSFGGGVYATNTSLLDMDLGGYPCSGPRCSQLSHNIALNDYGGGVYASLTSVIDLRQVFTESNTASLGGGLYAYQSSILLYNDLLARNSASAGSGDGVRIYTGATLNGQHNTFANNDTGGAATGSAITISGGSLSLSNSIIWYHTTSIDLIGQTVTCSDIQGGYTGTGNLNTNPLFVDAANSNFHLQSTSPAIDRCAAGQSLDFDNETRPVIYQAPAAPYDMGADEASPRVGINGAACAYGRIQDAVDAAVSGDTIQMVAGTFFQKASISNKNLTVIGGFEADCQTKLVERTTLDGANSGSVVTLVNSNTTLRDLVITHGSSSYGGGVSALPGTGQIVLDNTDVINNTADYGAGLYVDYGNTLTLTNDSDISNNMATVHGGGARVWGRLIANDWDSSISGNISVDGGGVSLPGGELNLSGSHILNNQASAAAGRGGGIHAYNNATVTISGSSNISTNSAFNGAGLYAEGADIQLGSAIFHSNAAVNNGGGVYLMPGSTLTSNGATIGYPAVGWGGNTALNGAGMYVDGSTVTFAGNIFHNVAESQGAGLYATAATLAFSACKIGGINANEPNQLGADGHVGVGMYLTNGTTATLMNCDISSNSFQTAGFTYGGGAYVAGSSLALVGSTVQHHTAPSATDGRGAGIYVIDGTLTLDDSQVLSNTAGTVGGGIRLINTTTLNILNGSELRDNHASAGVGGAIAATGTADINISTSTLAENSAGTHGGAISLEGGTVDFSEWWRLNDNLAGGNGGALAVSGSGDVRFTSNTAGSSILNNHSNGNGGGIWLNNNTTLELYSTNGYLLSISGNDAGGNGGAAYADNGGMFDVYGRVVFTANGAATGNGGAIYLSNNSRVWLDDYNVTGPEFWVNWAQNGGAIYALNSPMVACDGASFGSSPSGNFATPGSGGAVYVQSSTFDADNCSFYNNKAAEHGGAIAAYASNLHIYASFSAVKNEVERQSLAPQVILATSCNPLSGPCSSFTGNLADSDGNLSGSGGAIFSSDSLLDVNHLHFNHNGAARGGAIYQEGAASVGQVANTLIHHNTVSIALGAGIRTSGGQFTVNQTTLADNIGGSGFSGVANEVKNTIAWGNSVMGFSIAPLSASCNIDDGGLAGLNLNPQFVAAGAGENYHLRVTSPAVNACATGLTPDLDNFARPYGSAYDMGAFEYGLSWIYLPVVVR